MLQFQSILILIFREYCGGTKYEGTEKLEGKTVVVTGASDGIGKETVKDLAARGARVIMACRDMKKCEEVRKEIVMESSNR